MFYRGKEQAGIHETVICRLSAIPSWASRNNIAMAAFDVLIAFLPIRTHVLDRVSDVCQKLRQSGQEHLRGLLVTQGFDRHDLRGIPRRIDVSR